MKLAGRLIQSSAGPAIALEVSKARTRNIVVTHTEPLTAG